MQISNINLNKSLNTYDLFRLIWKNDDSQMSIAVVELSVLSSIFHN